jgi:hypothetical protein
VVKHLSNKHDALSANPSTAKKKKKKKVKDGRKIAMWRRALVEAVSPGNGHCSCPG